MKTCRPVLVLAVVCCSWPGVVGKGWAVEPKTPAPVTQRAAPAKVGPTVAATPMTRPTGNPTLAPQVVIMSPGAGETLYGGQTYSIQWKTLAIPQGARVKIEFLQSGGKTVPVADNLPSPGKYSWRIGSDAYMWKPGEVNPGIFLPGDPQTVEQGRMLETQGRLRLTAS